MFGQKIISHPTDVTETIRGTANFTCKIDFGNFIKYVSWQFGNNNILYSLYGAQEDYPIGNAKYKVTKQQDTFILEVRDLDPNDGGIYSCHTVDDDSYVVLLILGKFSFFSFMINQ